LGQKTKFSFGQVTEFLVANGHTHQPKHGLADCLDQSSNVPISAFVQHNFQPGILLPLPQYSHSPRSQELAIHAYPLQKPLDERGVSQAIHLDVIDLFQMTRRISDSPGPSRIVGEQQQSLHSPYPGVQLVLQTATPCR